MREQALEESTGEEWRKKEKSSISTDTESHSGTGSLRWRHPSFLSAHWSPTPDTIQSHITWHMWHVLWWTVPCVVACSTHICVLPIGTYFSKTAASSLAPHEASKCAIMSGNSGFFPPSAFDFCACDDKKIELQEVYFFIYPSGVLVKALKQQDKNRLKTQQPECEFEHTHWSANYFVTEHRLPKAERSSESSRFMCSSHLLTCFSVILLCL